MTEYGCDQYRDEASRTRRSFLSVGSLAGMGLCLGDFLKLEAAQKHYVSKEGTARSVIQIVCVGGIAAQESWNPKPEAPLEYRGPLGVVKTKVPGVVMSELMPRMAGIADKLCVVRSVVGKEADHGRAMYAMLTGHRKSPAIKHPSVGSIVSHEFGPRNDLPPYITIPGLTASGAGTGYLNPRYGAFSVGGDPARGKGFQVRDVRLPPGVTDDGFLRRRHMRDVINDQFRRLEADTAPLDTMDAFYQQAYSMISSESVRNAFDLSQESKQTKAAYGLNMYLENGTYGQAFGSQAGMRCLLARRLVEAGARFVSLTYGSWDNHVRIREAYDTQMPALDHALSALIQDLDARGLLSSTLVWVVSEFGRTPKVNASAGRDHYARVFSVGMAGGGLKQGLFHGDSDATSSEPEKDPVPLPNLHATIYRCLGINSDKELMAPGERPIEIVDNAKVEEALLA